VQHLLARALKAPRLLFHHDTTGESTLGYDSLPPKEGPRPAACAYSGGGDSGGRGPPPQLAHGGAGTTERRLARPSPCPSTCCLRSSGSFRVILRYRPRPASWLSDHMQGVRPIDNGQFQTMISSHLRLLPPPMLQPLVGKPTSVPFVQTSVLAGMSSVLSTAAEPPTSRQRASPVGLR
jgi:hypothetical protein